MTFKVNDRVYYRDDGPDDKGTVTAVNEFHTPFGPDVAYLVEWDNGIENGEYTGPQLVKA